MLSVIISDDKPPTPGRLLWDVIFLDLNFPTLLSSRVRKLACSTLSRTLSSRLLYYQSPILYTRVIGAAQDISKYSLQLGYDGIAWDYCQRDSRYEYLFTCTQNETTADRGSYIPPSSDGMIGNRRSPRGTKIRPSCAKTGRFQYPNHTCRHTMRDLP